MADRYWVGGTGTWDGTSTTNWAASSGGASGASVPTSADNVFFDANSNVGTGTFTVTMATTPRVCNDFTASGLDGTMTLAGTSIGLTVSGSLTFQSTNFSRTYTGTTTFAATTTGKTVTTAGVSLAVVTFNGVGGGWTLGSALTATGIITLTNGTLNTSATNYAITAAGFSSNNSNTRTLTLNGSQLTFSNSGATGFIVSSSLTLNPGSSTISMSALGPTFAGAGLTYYNFSFSSTNGSSGDKTVTGANTFNDFTVVATSSSASACNAIAFSANQTISGTLTVVGSGGIKRQFLKSDVIGTSRTLTCAAIAAMTDIDFRDITIAGAAGTLSGTRLGDCGGNSNITFGAGVPKYWNLAAGGSWNATAWATSSGGAVADTNFPLAQDTANIENVNLNTSATITFNNFEYNLPSFNASTRSNALTIATTGANNPIFYGNFAWGSGLSTSSARTFYFINRSTKTFDSAGYTFSTPDITIEAPGGGIQLINNNLTLGSASTTTLTQGTLDLNGRTFTAGLFTTSTGTKNITFNAGTLDISGSGATAFNNAVPTGFTTTAGTGTGAISMTSASAKTFVGGGSTYNCALNQGGAGTLTITGSNTFTNITNTVQPNQITFTANTTNTFTSFSLSGTAGNLITLRSSTAGTKYTLSDASGTISVSYLDIQDSTATGGATWRALATNGNVNSGNNNGWDFGIVGSFFFVFS
jgi:hypothetical protein